MQHDLEKMRAILRASLRRGAETAPAPAGPGGAPAGLPPMMPPAGGAMPPGMPMDPSMMGGAPGGMPMDPAMMAGAPPLEPEPAGGEPGGTEELLREAIEKLDAMSERVAAIERKLGDITEYDMAADLGGTPDLPMPDSEDPGLPPLLPDVPKQAASEPPAGLLRRLYSMVSGA